MDRAASLRLDQELPADALVLDVGGGGSPYFRADYVLDFTPFSDAKPTLAGKPARFTQKTWIQADICERRPWPIADKFFDYVVCSHTLEDIRDPIWVCSELSRVAKAGYVETPSRIVEQTIGVESPNYAGYTHHRWLLSEKDGVIEFRLKVHRLHSLPEAIVTRLDGRRAINPKYSIFQYEWRDEVKAREVIEFDEDDMGRELADVARGARALPDLTVPVSPRFSQRMRRYVYFQRLRWSRP